MSSYSESICYFFIFRFKPNIEYDFINDSMIHNKIPEPKSELFEIRLNEIKM